MATSATVFIGLAALLAHSVALSQTCEPRARQLSEQWQRKVTCNCGPALSRLTVTLPKGLSVSAACGLRKSTASRDIDLTKESLNMDGYDPSGDYPSGILYLSGMTTLSGSVRVEPGNSGELWFRADLPITNSRTVFALLLQEFKIEEKDYGKFGVTVDLLAKECSIAKAKARFQDFRVVLGETDEAGVYPLSVKVLQLKTFKKCGQK
jgi:hypothetical protein